MILWLKKCFVEEEAQLMSIFAKPTRYAVRENDPIHLAPPYASLVDRVEHQNEVFLNRAELRERVIHTKMLDAGKSLPSNGGLGMQATPKFVPEVLHGAILSSSI